MSDAFEEAVRGHGDQEFVLDTCVDDKFRVGLQVLERCGFGIVARAPGAVAEHVFRQIFHDGVEDHAVTINGRQRGIGLKFSEDMFMSVIAIEADQNP